MQTPNKTVFLFSRSQSRTAFAGFLVTFALSPFVSAAPLTSVSCATPSASLAIGTTSCSAVGLYGYATASAGSSVVLPASISQAAQIDVTSGVSALLGGVRGISSVSTAVSSNNVAITFDTASPVQSGYLELTFLQNQWSIPSGVLASELLTIGSYIVDPDGGSINSLFIPIQLGTDFSFSFMDTLIANGDSATGPISARLGADISLQAFASNKTTPVQLFDPLSNAVVAPEPASIGMLTIATLAGLLLMHKSRSRGARATAKVSSGTNPSV